MNVVFCPDCACPRFVTDTQMDIADVVKCPNRGFIRGGDSLGKPVPGCNGRIDLSNARTGTNEDMRLKYTNGRWQTKPYFELSVCMPTVTQ